MFTGNIRKDPSVFNQPPTVLELVSGLREVGGNSDVWVYDKNRNLLRIEPDNSQEFHGIMAKNWGRYGRL